MFKVNNKDIGTTPSVNAHNFAKLSQLKFCIPIHYFDIICLLDNQLDSETIFVNDN